jgi:hypothetical protein
MRYGAEGYGLYWYCLEHVCDNLEPRLTFELEHDSEILAHELKIDTLKVEEMMRYMVQLGLFEESEGVVTCMKLARHLGDNLTRNTQLKSIIKQSKSETVSDNLRLSQQEERRGEEKRGNKESRAKRKRFTPPTEDEVRERCFEMGYTVCPARFWNYYESQGWKVGKNSMKDWHKALAGWQARDGDKAKGSTRDSDIRDDLTDTSWAH